MNDTTIDALLPAAMLAEFRSRAPHYDAANAFFGEDLAALHATGYLAAPVPERLGGAGLTLEQLVIAQRRLAAHAPATALGVNMHLVWVQVARFLHDRGVGANDDAHGSGGDAATDAPRTPGTSRSLDWILREAVAGEVFAFGISEAGNEAVLLDAHSRATLDDDGAGFRVTGTKIFTTLSPAWTRLGVHARCEAPGEDPALVFGFVRRDGGELAEGSLSHPGTWNPLGMRATQSYTTRLDGVRIDARDVAAVMAPFDATAPLVLAIFSAFSILTAAVYAGIADRALELATEAARSATRGPDGAEGVRLDDPDTAARLTAALLDHRASIDTLTLLARDVDTQASRSDWFVALAAARNRVTDEARSAVDVAMRLVGARGFQADAELARLYRDVLAGLFHPSSSRALARTVRGAVLAE